MSRYRDPSVNNLDIVEVTLNSGSSWNVQGRGAAPDYLNTNDIVIDFKSFSNSAEMPISSKSYTDSSGLSYPDWGQNYADVYFYSSTATTGNLFVQWSKDSVAPQTLQLRVAMWNYNVNNYASQLFNLAPCTNFSTVHIWTYNCIRGDSPPCGAPVNADVYRDGVKIGTADSGGYYTDYPAYGTHSYSARWSGYSSSAKTVTGNASFTLYIFTPF